MAVVTPPLITPLPTPPSTTDPGNFDTRADAFLGALPTFQTEENALANNVFNNATDAANSATAANNSKNAAATSASDSAGSATAALNSANAAADSATNASNSATAAAGSAANSATSATNAGNSATAADSSATNASNSATAAAGSATQAMNYRDQAQVFATQSMTATSSTSNSVSMENKTFTIQTGKAFVSGQYIVISRTSAPSVFMQGFITSYNSSTGELQVGIDYSAGSGTYTDWSIGLIGRRGSSGSRPVVIISADTTAVAGNHYIFESVCKLTLPATPNLNDIFGFSNCTGVAGPQIDFGANRVKSKLPGVVTMRSDKDAANVIWTGNTSIGYGEI